MFDWAECRVCDFKSNIFASFGEDFENIVFWTPNNIAVLSSRLKLQLSPNWAHTKLPRTFSNITKLNAHECTVARICMHKMCYCSFTCYVHDNDKDKMVQCGFVIGSSQLLNQTELFFALVSNIRVLLWFLHALHMARCVLATSMNSYAQVYRIHKSETSPLENFAWDSLSTDWTESCRAWASAIY